MHDLKFALRQLRKNPGFASVAVLTLALCLGSNLTIFALVDSILLRPLPFSEPDRLVSIYNSYPGIGTERADSSFPNLYSRREAIDAFSHVAGYHPDSATVGGMDSVERKDILRVSSDFLAALRVPPIIGRSFSEEEMTFQSHHVAILSEDYWRQRFNADPAVLGKEVRVNGFSKLIVGVLPPQFRFLSFNPQILLPLSSDPDQRGIDSLHNPTFQLLARLKPGATLEQAQAQVDAHNKTQGADFPYASQVAAAGFHSKVAPLHSDHVAGVRPVLLLMQAGVLFLLLIGGVNLVNLLLVRASARTKELAIRQSMGATRKHIIGQVLTESVLLCLAGGVCGLLVGAGGIRLLTVLGMDHLPLGAEIALEGRPAWVSLLASVVVGIAVAVPIAWFNLRGQPSAALQSESRGGTSAHAAQRLRHGFIVAQIALAFVLLTGAGLLGVSLKHAMDISPGFRPDHVLAGHVSLLHKEYLDPSIRLAFAERLVNEIALQPGILAFGVANDIPVNGTTSASSKRVMTALGQSAEKSVHPHVPNIYGVFGDYFTAMGIPLLDGRVFDRFEFKTNQRICIVDEAFARRYWPRDEAIGKRVYDGPEIEDGEEPFTIVGMVGTVKHSHLTELQSEGAVYFPGGMSPLGFDRFFIVTRTHQRPEAFGPTLQALVQSIEPQLPVQDLRSMGTRIADSLQVRRSPALLAAIFAGVALTLAAVGTYGVLSYAVAQRRREIGVRMALGALPGQIGRHFLIIGLRLLGGGIALGLFGAWAAGRTMQSLLFDVPSFHLTTLTLTAAVLGIVSLMACLFPTLRASRVHPMEALRQQ